MPIFYVRGHIMEMTKATVMLVAKNKPSAQLQAVKFGLTGSTKVYTKDEWDTTGGVTDNEHFILGYIQK